jgi:hypothetical protein
MPFIFLVTHIFIDPVDGEGVSLIRPDLLNALSVKVKSQVGACWTGSCPGFRRGISCATKKPSGVHHAPVNTQLLSNPNPSRLSACSVSLRLNAEQNSILNFLSASSTILSSSSPFPASSAVLYRTVSATLHTAVSSHSISIGPASAATTSGFLLAAREH